MIQHSVLVGERAMMFDITLFREFLSVIEAKPSSLKKFEGAKAEAERKQLKELSSFALRSQLLFYNRSAFNTRLELTAAGRELLEFLRNEKAFSLAKEQIKIETRAIDLADLKACLLKASTAASVASPAPTMPTRRPSVFLVHGHDIVSREQATNFLERLGVEVIALDEQYNAGKTVIEKFEDNTDVNFAVILLTEDDVGGKSSDALQPRPRQNVIFELGYFMGRLRRTRVCAIKKRNVELPSDILGMVWLSFEGRWKRDLAIELEKAGYSVDRKRLID
jgi:predicted nucleotide-binding protein